MPNGYYRDPTTGQVIFVGNADMNRELTRGKVFVGTEAPSGGLPEGATGTNQQGVPGNWQANPRTGIVEFTPLDLREGQGGEQDGAGLDLSGFRGERDEAIKRRGAEFERQRQSSRASFEAFTNQIRATGEAEIARQKELNTRILERARTRAIRKGTARFASETAEGILTGEEQIGLSRISEIESKMTQAIAEATIAMEKQDFTIVNASMQSIDDLNEKFDAQIKDFLEKAQKKQDEIEKAENERKKVDSLFDTALSVAGNEKGELDLSKLTPESLYFNFPKDTPITFKEIFDFVDSVKKSKEEEEGIPEGWIARYEYAKGKGWIGDNVTPFEFKQMEEEKIPTDSFTKIDWGGQDAILNTKTGKVIVSSTPQTGENAVIALENQPYIDAAQNLGFLPGVREDQGKNLVNLVQNSIREGNPEKAKKTIELFAYNRMDTTEQANYDLADVVKETSEQALNFIEQGKIAGTGPYKQVFQKFKTWGLSKRNPALAELNYWISVSNAQVRRAFFGVAVTQAESGTANKFLVQDSDDLQTIEMKLLGSRVFNDWVQEAKLARMTGLEAPSLQTKLKSYGVDTNRLSSPKLNQLDTKGDIPVFLSDLIGKRDEQIEPNELGIPELDLNFIDSLSF